MICSSFFFFCYAQTEVKKKSGRKYLNPDDLPPFFFFSFFFSSSLQLGHGSNVQGLETTATYLADTNEFDLHSPTLTASKWWIGGLGKTANYAIVMARLVIHGQDHGPHPFCVQIRRLDNHQPLPGVTVGDIGPKFGFNGVDNGFIMFDHVRIPHISFLAGYAQVVPGTGEYIKPPNAKLSYGTMVYVRANIVMGKYVWRVLYVFNFTMIILLNSNLFILQVFGWR